MNASRSSFFRSSVPVLIPLLSSGAGPAGACPAGPADRALLRRLPGLRLRVVAHELQLLRGDRRVVLLAERDDALQALEVLDAVERVLELVRVGRARLLDQRAENHDRV